MYTTHLHCLHALLYGILYGFSRVGGATPVTEPCPCPADPYPVEHMYYRDPGTQQFRSVRTTSQVENLNRWYNGLLQGPVQPGLSDALSLEFAARCNIDQAARAGHSLGVPGYDLQLISALNSVYPPDQKPYPRWAEREQLAQNSVQEGFGFRWQQQSIAEAIYAANRQDEGEDTAWVEGDEDADGAAGWFLWATLPANKLVRRGMANVTDGPHVILAWSPQYRYPTLSSLIDCGLCTRR